MSTLRRTFAILFLYCIAIVTCWSQKWEKEEIVSANTAYAVDYMNDKEKTVLMYINLARMYPYKFARVEVEAYTGPAGFSQKSSFNAYKKSLLDDLYSRQPAKPLQPSLEMYESACCWAEESGRLGITGHKRVSCSKPNCAECCSYGVNLPIDVVLQWLIDADVPSLGHRINCLNPQYTKAGISQKPHTQWNYCTVMDAIW